MDRCIFCGQESTTTHVCTGMPEPTVTVTLVPSGVVEIPCAMPAGVEPPFVPGFVRQELPPHILNDCPADADDRTIIRRARHTIYALRPFKDQCQAQWRTLTEYHWLLAELRGISTNAPAGDLLNRFLQIRGWVNTYLEEHKLPDLADPDYKDIRCTCGSGAHPRTCLKHPWGMHTHCEELNIENLRANLEEAEKSEELLKAEVQRLRAERTQYDCRYTPGPVADLTGSHCPMDEPCLRCQNERLTERVNDLEHDCEVMARGAEEAKSPEYNESVIEELSRENARLTTWVNDLQAGMSVNCVYCGHNYGPKEDTPATMADILKAHVEQCPKHPLSAAKARIAELEALNDVRSGEWCKQNRAEGRGGCGMCAVCCNELKERAENAELKLTVKLDGYRELAEKAAKAEEERDRAVMLHTEEESIRWRLEARVAELEAKLENARQENAPGCWRPGER
jgi:hypothetical protein